MIRVLAVGKAAANTPEMAIFERYAERMTPKMALVEVPDGRGSPAEIKKREAGALLGAVKAGEFLVALDAGGVAFDSAGLAGALTKWLENHGKVAFLIGGAEGLDGSVLEKVQAVWSLGRLTWPHVMVRGMVAEQVYRARMITAGHPYHRSGRP